MIAIINFDKKTLAPLNIPKTKYPNYKLCLDDNTNSLNIEVYGVRFGGGEEHPTFKYSEIFDIYTVKKI